MRVDVDLLGVAALISAVGTVAIGVIRLLRNRDEDQKNDESASVIGMLAERIRELEQMLNDCRSSLRYYRDARHEKRKQRQRRGRVGNGEKR